MNELIFKSAQSVTDLDEEKGLVKGVASVFGNVDSDGDVLVKGAYQKTIQENRSRIKYLYQHRLDQPVGVIKELSESERGLEFVAKIAVKTRLGSDVFEMIKSGVINENSVGFSTIKEKYDKEKGVNYIQEVKLWEVSAVTLAANPLAFIEEVKAKNMGEKNEVIIKYLTERFEALNKLVKSNISDELGLAVEFEIKSLKELALKGLTEPIEEKGHSAEEEVNSKGDENKLVELLIKNL